MSNTESHDPGSRPAGDTAAEATPIEVSPAEATTDWSRIAWSLGYRMFDAMVDLTLTRSCVHCGDEMHSIGEAAVQGNGSGRLPSVCSVGQVSEGHPFSDEMLCRRCAVRLGVMRIQHACVRCGLPVGEKERLKQIVAESGGSSASTRENGAAGKQNGRPRRRGGRKPGCDHCKQLDLEFDAMHALGIYRDELRGSVIASKNMVNLPLATVLGRALGRHLQGLTQTPLAGTDGRMLLPAVDEVTFVPSHFWRVLRRRGCPAEMLATQVSRQLGVPMRPLLVCRRLAAKQGTLSEEDRRKNAQAMFMARGSMRHALASVLAKIPTCGPLFDAAADSQLQSRHILLVDDVLTTGSTGSAAAATLKAAGARRVTMGVVARAIPRQR